MGLGEVEGTVGDAGVVESVFVLQSSTALFSPKRKPNSVRSASCRSRSCRTVIAFPIVYSVHIFMYKLHYVNSPYLLMLRSTELTKHDKLVKV